MFHRLHVMKDSVSVRGYTRKTTRTPNQLFLLRKVGDEDAGSVIGEDELSLLDKKYLEFVRIPTPLRLVEAADENRTIIDKLSAPSD